MTKRRLRPEELELWKQVASSADPLPNRPAPKALKPAKVVEHRNNAPKGPDPLPSFVLGEKTVHTDTHYFPKTTSQRLKSDPVQMDAKAFGKLKRGKLVPEARIDLHGMTLDQAHGALGRFILSSQARGLRLVLVITGKGSREDPYDPMPRRRGVLKSQVPQWLRMAPLGQMILQVSEAHRSHGGSGAYYVYLRRSR
ncbi:MAG: Smr/MutS family protein [Pelagimonas sp.]|jgi:DNA-nicking Smr family endonuclease|nr:Smr/MutS family protein [Pelagimonas sp.]